MSARPAPDVPGVVPASQVEPMLTPAGLRRVLDISERTYDRLRAAGRLPRPDLTIGRMFRWRPETINKWIDQQAEGRGRRP